MDATEEVIEQIREPSEIHGAYFVVLDSPWLVLKISLRRMVLKIDQVEEQPPERNESRRLAALLESSETLKSSPRSLLIFSFF